MAGRGRGHQHVDPVAAAGTHLKHWEIRNGHLFKMSESTQQANTCKFITSLSGRIKVVSRCVVKMNVRRGLSTCGAARMFP